MVLNVSDVSSITVADTYDTTGSASAVAVSGNYAYVADDTRGVIALNVSDASSVTLVDSFNTVGTSYGVAVSGNDLYVADHGNGLVINVLSYNVYDSVVFYNNDGYWAQWRTTSNMQK